ncbi:hypothetical protein AB9P05_00890 [Roseivirga sp. BDSF3-8]|uniref:hypothetical protein n=1 Tax=Roseivirga sp. BDSF3-8 TaxID=3241598 RepID=UPI003531C9A9
MKKFLNKKLTTGEARDILGGGTETCPSSHHTTAGLYKCTLNAGNFDPGCDVAEAKCATVGGNHIWVVQIESKFAQPYKVHCYSLIPLSCSTSVG